METAFLYGDFKEEINVECPQDRKDVENDDSITLDKCIYGLVQAARNRYEEKSRIQ